MMPKSDIIAAIMKLNSAVDPEFLAEFSNEELWEYLQRLASVRGVSSPADALQRTHPEPARVKSAAV